MKAAPTSQLITAYAAFERNRSRSLNNARDVLKRGLSYYASERSIRAHLLTALGQLELRARQPDVAVEYLTKSVDLADPDSNPGEQHRLLALAYATLSKPNITAAWAAVTKATTRGVSFSQAEVLQLIWCLFGGANPRLQSLLRFLESQSFKVVTVGERLDAAFVHRPPLFLPLLVRAPSIYSSTYDLADDLLLACHLGEDADYAVVKQAEDLFDYYRRNANVNPTSFFLACGDLSTLRQQLMRRAEQPGKPIIIPLPDTLLGQHDTDDESGAAAATTNFRGLLHEWLFQVDRFRSNQPVSGRNFFGREKIFRSIEAQIEEGRSIGVFGLRKIGKTSILKQLAHRRLVDIVGYVDLQGLPPGVDSVDYVLWLIGDALAKAAKAKYGRGVLAGMRLFGQHLSFPGRPVGLDFDGDLNRLAAQSQDANLAAKCRIIIMLDEVERIIPLPNRRGIAKCDELFGYLRGKAQLHSWFISIVAGANAKVVEEPHWMGLDNPVFRFYQPVYLPPLEPEESSEMVTVLGRGMGITFDVEALDEINGLTGRHPYVVRQLCSLLARTFPERPLSITSEHVERVGTTFAVEEHATFREMFERLHRDFPDELRILRHLANVGRTTLHDLEALFGRGVKERIGHLRGYSVVEKDAADQYSISFPLLQQWVRSEIADLDG